jgi:hypothetical protein
MDARRAMRLAGGSQNRTEGAVPDRAGARRRTSGRTLQSIANEIKDAYLRRDTAAMKRLGDEARALDAETFANAFARAAGDVAVSEVVA